MLATRRPRESAIYSNFLNQIIDKIAYVTTINFDECIKSIKSSMYKVFFNVKNSFIF